MKCSLHGKECLDCSDTSTFTEFAGEYAYVRCRQTGALFVVMTAENHGLLMKRLALLNELRARVLVDWSAEYGVDEKQGGFELT